MATYLQSNPGIYKITSIASRKLSGKRANKTTFKYI
jgi:hypothetical protein